jgi:hypothetical protein
LERGVDCGISQLPGSQHGAGSGGDERSAIHV